MDLQDTPSLTNSRMNRLHVVTAFNFPRATPNEKNKFSAIILQTCPKLIFY